MRAKPKPKKLHTIIHAYELKAEDVGAYTSRTLITHFKRETPGYYCSTEMFYDVLVKACAVCISLEASCADIEHVSENNKVCEYVYRILLI